jgi:hypothetical protein
MSNEDPECEAAECEDPVEAPGHYCQGSVECIDAIESAVEPLTGAEAFCVGSVIKYIWRWKLKNGLEDLLKARWYLNRLITHVQADAADSSDAENHERSLEGQDSDEDFERRPFPTPLER